MKAVRVCSLALVTSVGAAVAAAPAGTQASVWPDTLVAATTRLPARVVAVGLPGVAGLRQVGRFHSGGPIPGNPEFLLSTGPGRVLDPERVLVALGDNLGAPLADASQAPGAVLSIDPNVDGPLVVPADFAAAGAQAEAAGGAIRLYTAHSPPFSNDRYNPSARTGAFSAASGPRYISMNNAFGRPWIANAPAGWRGAGSLSVVDPDGAPLENAPSEEAGGVFAGRFSNRERAPDHGQRGWLARWLPVPASGQLTPGALAQGALGTAFLGPSPDGSGFAVFAVVTADGAVAQAHVRDGVDGLAPPGTVGGEAAGGVDPGVIGVAFQWNPERVLYLADRSRDRLVALHLADDGRQLVVARSRAITSPALRGPVDVAPAVPEIANPRFASHSTLAGGSDLYVANRGDGSLLRVGQDGQVLARAEIDVPGLGPLGPDRLRALAVSADAQRIWVTVDGEIPGFAGQGGALLELAGFDAAGPFGQAPAADETVLPDSGGMPVASAKAEPVRGPDSGPADPSVGAQVFGHDFTPGEGLGPLFNGRSCVSCHPGGGQGTDDEDFVRRVARMDPVTGRVAPVTHPDGPVARRFAARAGEAPGESAARLPRAANVLSLRMPPALAASARLDEIPDAVIAAQAVSKGDGIRGRVHRVTGADGRQRVGRFGWKGHIASLEEMVADAFANELGVTGPLAPPGAQPPGAAEDDGRLARDVAAFLRTLPARGAGSP